MRYLELGNIVQDISPKGSKERIFEVDMPESVKVTER